MIHPKINCVAAIVDLKVHILLTTHVYNQESRKYVYVSGRYEYDYNEEIQKIAHLLYNFGKEAKLIEQNYITTQHLVNINSELLHPLFTLEEIIYNYDKTK